MSQLYAEFGYASLPALGHSESGDRILVQRDPSHVSLLLIDVAGHGASAAAVAKKLKWPMMPPGPLPSPEAMLIDVHHQLEGGVGAAGLALVMCFLTERFLYAGLGSMQLYHSRLGALELQAGHLGKRRLGLREKCVDLRPGDAVVACTDGIQNRGFVEHIEHLSGSAYQQASTLLQRQGKNHDDATIALLRVGSRVVDG